MRTKEPNPELWHSGHVETLAFRRLPVLWAAAWFCAGIALARFVWQPAVVWMAALGLLAALVFVRVRVSWIRLVPLAALWAVLGLACFQMQPAAPPQAELRAFADGLSRNVVARVVRVRPLPAQEGETPGAASVDLAVEQVEEVTPDLARMVPVDGGIRATVVPDAAMPALQCGDRVETPMQMRVPERFRDPGAWQYGDYLLEQGIGAHAVVKASRLAGAIQPGRPPWRCRLYAVQAWAAGRMMQYAASPANQALPRSMRLDQADAGMLNAMLFGDRAGLNRELRLGFELTGSFHLFVVSGMHVALIALGLAWIARWLRLRGWPATAFIITLTAAYALMTGFGIPVQRALWMTALFLVARRLDRERSPLNALGAAALGVLVWSPRSLFEASFQMTFLAIVAVAGIAIPLGEWSFLPYARAARRLPDLWLDAGYEPRLAEFRVLLRMAGEPLATLFGPRASRWPANLARAGLWTLELCLVALVVEAVMALPMAVYFHRAVVFGLPANIVSVPLVAVLVPVAVVTFLAGLLSPWLALLPGAATAILLHGVAWFIGHIARGHIAHLRAAEPAWWALTLAAGCLAFSCLAVRRRLWVWPGAAALPILMALVLWPERPVVTPGMLEVTAIDVGQGDSLLVTGPTGHSMLIDAGGPVGGLGPVRTQAATGFDIGEEVVSPYLWSRRMRRLDVVALTHEHSDHMGGMPAVLRNFRPRELWVGIDVPSTAYASLLQEAASLGIAIRHLRAGDTLDWDGIGIAVLGPAPGYGNTSSPKNDDSLVLRMQFGAASVLLEGDAEKPEEAAMLAAGLSPVTLLKVGHHGSATSSTDAFLTAAAPRAAVISVGRGNTFGHPRGEVISRLAGRGVLLYRTDLLGLTTFLLDRDGAIKEVGSE